MAWIDVIAEEKATGDLAEQYSQLIELWGGVDNILESLQTYVVLYKTLLGHFSQSEIVY